MKNKKIGISTVYTGYNYGSSLQAFATKTILGGMGYDAEVLKMRGSLVPGRDVRLKKLFTIAFRSVIHRGTKALKNYNESMSKVLPEESVKGFNSFISEQLCPKSVSYGELKKMARSEEYEAFVCGSDQVWNSAVFYVDPFYYLRFAPRSKRIAFAPSFGRDFVPKYNRKKITKYISEIDYKSVREASGIKIIKELTDDDATVLVDPTLVLNKDEWTASLDLREKTEERYLLAYFLDTPSPRAVECVNKISAEYGLKVVTLPYIFENSPWENSVSAGPREFLEYVKNAAFVCTDSFHGTAFSLNFNTPFYTFERNYGNAGKQSARIVSILDLVSLKDRYEPKDIEGCMDISFEDVNSVLDAERNKSKEYLRSVLADRGNKKNG